MENKINIVKLLKDCQRGMELDSVMFNNATLWKVEEGAQFPIAIKVGIDDIYFLTEYGEWNDGDINAKCTIFPKGKNTWEGFVPPCKFKDGDIVASPVSIGGTWIGIFKQYEDTTFNVYCSLSSIGEFHNTISSRHILEGTHIATEDEKQNLYNAIVENGYRWNAEKKCLEKLTKPKFKVGDRVKRKKDYIYGVVTEFDGSEYKIKYNSGAVSYANIEYQDEWELILDKFDISTLQPYISKVLTRDDEDSIWQPCVWGLYDKGHGFPYITTGNRYKYCIPYNGNDHLLGSTDDCIEYYKTWED